MHLTQDNLRSPLSLERDRKGGGQGKEKPALASALLQTVPSEEHITAITRLV